MGMRGIRGAITVANDTREEIFGAAQKLMQEIFVKNALTTEEIGAVIFSMTEDLTAAFPTAGVRKLQGFSFVPLFDARQCAIENSMKRCIRVLVLCDTEKTQREIQHVYLGDAAMLRPDIAHAVQ